MDRTYDMGTGENLCTTPKEIRRKLNNLLVELEEAEQIARVLGIFMGDMRTITIKFIHRKGYCGTWGTACRQTRTVRILRPSITILLHELAHIFAPRNSGHNAMFALTLDICYGHYLNYLKVKQEKKKEVKT